jgi:cytochrome oxidase assembly protein ShyY1
VAPYLVVLVGDTSIAGHPARRELPVLDDGPHRSYAVQWFCFAAIALGGAAAVIRRERGGSARA